MNANTNGLDHDAMEYFLEMLSGLGPGDEGFVDLDDMEIDRATAERYLGAAADELGLEIEIVPSALVFRVADEELELPAPRAAWLLVGDEGSLLERDDLDDINAEDDDHGLPMWTALPNISPGDTLFLYFRGDREAVRFVARAMDRPAWESSDEEDEEAEPQWWVPFSSVIEIEPIALEEVADLVGHPLELDGQAGVQLAPEIANALLRRTVVAYASDAACSESALEPVLERSPLVDPALATLDDVCALSSADLADDRAVGTHVVEPLLRLCGISEPEFAVHRDHTDGRRAADYAILADGAVRAVVEVEHRVRLDAGGDWADSPDVEVAADHAEAFDAPFLVVDCDQILLFDPLEGEPYLVLDRFDLDEEDLEFLRAHLTDEEV